MKHSHRRRAWPSCGPLLFNLVQKWPLPLINRAKGLGPSPIPKWYSGAGENQKKQNKTHQGLETMTLNHRENPNLFKWVTCFQTKTPTTLLVSCTCIKSFWMLKYFYGKYFFIILMFLYLWSINRSIKVPLLHHGLPHTSPFRNGCSGDHAKVN